MTLVLTALTQREVVQVSDRRFTYTRYGVVTSRNDEKNKAVLFCGRLMFGFTGRGDLGTKRRTDLWLAERISQAVAELQSADQAAILNAIAAKATSLFARAYRGERHAFVAAGWARFVTKPVATVVRPDEFEPYLAVISNFHDERGNELPAVQESFQVWIRRLQLGDGGLIWSTPSHLSGSELANLIQRLQQADARADSDAIVRTMAEQIYAVADRDPNVGRGLMITVLPREALGNADGFVALAGPPDTRNQTFLYVPPSGDTIVQLGPVATCGGGIMSGFRAGPLELNRDQVLQRPDDPPGLLRRWYLVPVVGTGTREDPYRAETLGLSHAALMPTDDSGQPRYERALTLVVGTDHRELEEHPAIVPVVDVDDLVMPFGDLDTPRQKWLQHAAREVQADNAGTARDILEAIGRTFDSDFDPDGYWNW